MSQLAAQLEPKVYGDTVDGDIAKISTEVRRRVYSGVEHGEIEVPIDALLLDKSLDLYPEVKGAGLFQIRFNREKLVFQAGKYIGLIPVNPRVTIDVAPRVPLDKLERILSISGLAPKVLDGHHRYFDSHSDSFSSLLDVYTSSLLELVDEIRQLGLLKEYLQVEEITNSPKGRILIGKTVKHRGAYPADSRVVSSWYQREVDNGPNRCIKAAIRALAEKYVRLKNRSGSKQNLSALNQAFHVFTGVHPDQGIKYLEHPYVRNPELIPELRSYYRNAVALSKTILLDKGLALKTFGREFALSSLIVDMGLVFEAYLRNTLVRRLEPVKYEVVDGNSAPPGGAKSLFNDDGRPRLGKLEQATPDILVFHGTDRSKLRLVIEVKYKVAKPVAERDDINQAVTYAVSYGVDRVMLVTPYHEKTKSGLHFLGEIGGTCVYQYNIGLGTGDLERQEAEFTKAVMLLVDSSTPYVVDVAPSV